MNKSLSVYLDCLRVAAALGVLLVHLGNSLISNQVVIEDARGQNFVVIFFVLSGFLIAFSAAKTNDRPKFFIDRISKLSTVVIPALIFTIVLYWVGLKIYPSIYNSINGSKLGFKIFVNFFYLSQSWNLCTIPPTNPSFWSLSYEFWYYIIFGMFYFLKGISKWVLVLIASLIAGIKILLLFPVWLLGVLAYYLSVRIKWTQLFSVVVFVISTLLLIYLIFYFPTNYFKWYDRGIPPLFYSATFLSDFLLGVILMLNMVAFSQIKVDVKNAFLIHLATRLSSHTFALYLFHFPILLFLSSLPIIDKSSWMHITALALTAYLFSSIISKPLDNTRKFYKNFFTSCISKYHKTKVK